MQRLLVEEKKIYEMLNEALVDASSNMPLDVEEKLRQMAKEEDNDIARLHLEKTLENALRAREKGLLTCCDTGYPMYYVRLGNNVIIEGGVYNLYRIVEKVTSNVTEEFKLRSNMVHPITRLNTGNNLGRHMPHLDLEFDPEFDGFEVTAVLKGGGSEVFGSYFRMLAPGDGLEGIIKFVIDSVFNGTKGGKTCPPVIVGIGIGGTSDVCMTLAKKSAVLPNIGQRHDEREIADMEEKLTEQLNRLGIGPMGTGGKNTVMDVHIDYAVTHTAVLPVAVNMQCPISRRSTIRYSG